MKVLSALRVSLMLRDDVVPEQSLSATASLVPVESNQRKKPAKQPLVNVPLTGGSRRPVASVLARRNDTTTLSDAQALRNANPHSDVLPTSKRNFVIRAKKGSW